MMIYLFVDIWFLRYWMNLWARPHIQMIHGINRYKDNSINCIFN